MIRRTNPRRGMISLASIFVVLALLALLATVWNSARAVHGKIEAQNAADAAAHAAGLQAVRSLNQITAINHATGELLAIAVLAFAPGGIELEEGRPLAFDRGAMRDLDAAFRAAQLAPVPPDEAIYRKASRGTSACGGAIGAARRTLVGELTTALQRHATDPQSALRAQAAVAAEWDRLDDLERLARDVLLPLKQRCNHTLIPELAAHARRVVGGTPARMTAAAADLGGTLPAPPELPVESEKALVAVIGWERSQMVRTTTPWVQYWRKPVLAFADAHLPLSRYAEHYLEWTNTFTPLMARWQADDYETYLFVPKGATGEKGREAWAVRGGEAIADELFGVVGSFRRGPESVFGRGLLRQPRPAGVAAFAQVLLYNANPQEPDQVPPAPRNPAEWQPVVGWDTLNWSPDVPVPEFRYGMRRDAADLVRQPRVRVNWRVKLAPVTRPVPAPHTDWPAPTH